MDIRDVDLNKPYGDPSLQIPEVSDEKPEIKEEPKVEVKVEEPKVEVKEGEEGTPADPDEEGKVPYNRFKKFHDRAKEADTLENELAEAREKLARLEREKFDDAKTESPSEIPTWWKKLYGDSAESKDAWITYSDHENEVKASAREQALEAVRQEKEQESIQEKQNLAAIEDNLDNLVAHIGRELTEKEELAVLDIQDEYTPKGNDGRYLGPLMSPEKAWEIYELKNQQASAPAKKSRDAVAAMTGSQSQGESISAEKQKEDASFVPGRWDGWRNKLKI